MCSLLIVLFRCVLFVMLRLLKLLLIDVVCGYWYCCLCCGLRLDVMGVR